MPQVQTLRVDLEEVGARHWWAALLATLSAQYGNAYMRFVGVVDGKPRYFSATFAVPRTWGSIPPREEWAPGMTAALAELRQQIEDDGWQHLGSGDRSWQLTYQRPEQRSDPETS